MPIVPITIDALTKEKLDGTGVFDILMRANKAHLEDQFKANRIKGAEYSQVYLGSLQAVLAGSIQFLLQKDKTDLEAQLLAQQILLTQVEVQKAEAELAIIQANLPKVAAEIALLEQQKLNLQDELLTAAKQRSKLDQDIANAVLEGTVLVAQECKLRAEYDVIILTKDKTIAESALLNQKVITERAQTTATGVDPDSVIGKQKLLYQAQTDGFARDAEQKATKILIDTWNVRRTTDEGTIADATNKLNDVTIGSVVQKMLNGVGIPG